MKSVALPELFAHTDPCLVHFDGIDIPVHYKPGSTKTLIILFHGAVDQKLRAYPYFRPHFRHTFGAHQIAISDPSLTQSRELKSTWFLGAQNIPLESILPSFFRTIASTGKFDRLIYFGASSGGHAALHYSYHHPGSIALVVNPQINLNRYLKPHIDLFWKHCWPSVHQNTDLDKVVMMDLRKLYSAKFLNSVCMLNSSGDWYHIFNQTADFIGVIPAECQKRFILHCDYYGIPGHGGSIPYESCIPWIRAVVSSPNLYAQNILTKFTQFRTSTRTGPVKSVTLPDVVKFNPEDIEMADALRHWQAGDKEVMP